ncbi:MAG TPA: hypothetical protein VK674_02835 [Candidatus Limnocylindria bacterium]|nr:hypothetical protein [Candidatus Limnocylindria bacterium]
MSFVDNLPGIYRTSGGVADKLPTEEVGASGYVEGVDGSLVPMLQVARDIATIPEA